MVRLRPAKRGDVRARRPVLFPGLPNPVGVLPEIPAGNPDRLVWESHTYPVAFHSYGARPA